MITAIIRNSNSVILVTEVGATMKMEIIEKNTVIFAERRRVPPSYHTIILFVNVVMCSEYVV